MTCKHMSFKGCFEQLVMMHGHDAESILLSPAAQWLNLSSASICLQAMFAFNCS